MNSLQRESKRHKHLSADDVIITRYFKIQINRGGLPRKVV